MDELAHLRAAERPDIGVITTPGWAAQGVADLLVRAGVTSILNFAPRVLTVPAGVHLRYVDLSIELQVLGFYRARQRGARRARGRRGRHRGARSRAALRSVGLSPRSDLNPGPEPSLGARRACGLAAPAPLASPTSSMAR